MKTYIDPTEIAEKLTAKQATSLYNQVQNFMYREETQGGSVTKLEKVYKDFDEWKAKNGFDKKSHMEDVSQALSDKM